MSERVDVMKILLKLLFLIMSISCSEILKQDDNSHGQHIEFQNLEFTHAWIMTGWTGYMTLIIALTEEEYFYWFFSDVVTNNQPKMPIRGTYVLTDSQLELHGDKFLYSNIWKRKTDEKGRDILVAPGDINDKSRVLYPFLKFFNPQNPLSFSRKRPANPIYPG
jgi:hypothetical protein